MNRNFPTPPARLGLRSGLALALACLSTGTAWAGFTSVAVPIGVYDRYFVTGSASAGAPGDGRAGGYECNVYGHGGYINDLRGCGATGGRWPAATALQGTVDSTGRTTSFTAQAQANAAHNIYDANNNPITIIDPAYSRARAAASLANASLHVSVANNADSGGFVAGSTLATLHDTLNFHVAGADANTTTRVQFQFAIDGSMVNDGRTTIYGEPGSGSLVSYFSLDNMASGGFGSPEYSLMAGATWENYRGIFTLPATGMVDDRGNLAQGSWSTLTLNSMVFDGYFDILGADAVINPTLSIALDCSIGLQCDYGNTAKLRFTSLPSTVSFTSNSGVFMSGLAPSASVPEPGSLVLLGLGLGAAGLLRRRSPPVRAGVA